MDTSTPNSTFYPSADGTDFSNISSYNQLCTESYNTFMSVLDILMASINLPVTLYVIVELFLKQCGAPAGPGNSPFSLSELFLLHLTSIHFFYYIKVLLSIARYLGGATGIRQEYITAFHSSSLTGGSSFFSAMTVDLYMAVAHPIIYVACKASTKRKLAHMYCAFCWVHVVSLVIIIVIFRIGLYHPLLMASFCVAVPVSLFCCTFALIALRSAGPGGQTSKLDKTKQSAIQFIMNSFIVLIMYYLPHICSFIYTLVKQIAWENLPCHNLPLMLSIQTAEFVAPLVFFYNTKKLGAIVTLCSDAFHKCIGLR